MKAPLRDIQSAPLEYIAAYENNKRKYRKVKIPTELTFEYPGLGFFEQLSNNLLRHDGRLNGHHLLLVESCLYYDAMTKKLGSPIYELYHGKLARIPNGETIGISGQALPEYILCSNQQVLKLRTKQRKIMHIPHFQMLSKEFKFCRILLYFPLAPGQVIDTDRLGLFILFSYFHNILSNIFMQMITSNFLTEV